MKNSMPLVSIVIPTKNRKMLLKDAVESALNQTYKNVEIIIHDNNSSDGTEELMRNYLYDERIKYHRVNQDLTMLENWRAALSYVKGEFFIRLDDDNVFFNYIIECAILELKKNQLQAIIYSPITSTPDGKLFKFFDESEYPLKILTAYEFLKLEFYCYTDTNYIVYDKSFLNSIVVRFEDIYQTTQPDRYLNYLIAAKMINGDIRVAFSSKVLGFSRYDYRSQVRDNYKLSFSLYNGFPKKLSLNFMEDCHYNFQMHRVFNLIEFMKNNNSSEINIFIKNKIISPSLYSVYALLGHLTESKIETNIIDLLKMNLMYLILIIKMLTKPFSIIDGKRSIIYVISVIRLCLIKNLKSLIAYFTKIQKSSSHDLNNLSRLIVEDNAIIYNIKPDYVAHKISKIKFFDRQY